MDSVRQSCPRDTHWSYAAEHAVGDHAKESNILWNLMMTIIFITRLELSCRPLKIKE